MFPSSTIVNTDLLFPKIPETSIAPIRPLPNPAPVPAPVQKPHAPVPRPSSGKK